MKKHLLFLFKRKKGEHNKIGDPMNLLITGARSGIAQYTIDQIKHQDLHIYLTVHTHKEYIAMKEKYKNNYNIHPLKLDITKESNRKKIEDIEIDILFCNAAVSYGGSISEISMDKVRENFEINVFSNFEIVQLALKQMIQRKKGKIIMMASLAGIIPIPFIGTYSATKASIIQMSSALRKELSLLDVEIPIVLIEPGFYKTGFNFWMFENKYDDFSNSYFKHKEKIIRKREELLLHVLEKKNLHSIYRCIYKAITKNHPKKVYRSPLLQKLGVFIYKIFS